MWPSWRGYKLNRSQIQFFASSKTPPRKTKNDRRGGRKLPAAPEPTLTYLIVSLHAFWNKWPSLTGTGKKKQVEVYNHHVMLSLRRIGTMLAAILQIIACTRFLSCFCRKLHGLSCFKHTVTVSLWILDLIQMMDFFPSCLLCIHHDVKIKGEEDKQQVDEASSQLRGNWVEGNGSGGRIYLRMKWERGRLMLFYKTRYIYIQC